jgi:hypothetical protein
MVRPAFEGSYSTHTLLPIPGPLRDSQGSVCCRTLAHHTYPARADVCPLILRSWSALQHERRSALLVNGTGGHPSPSSRRACTRVLRAVKQDAQGWRMPGYARDPPYSLPSPGEVADHFVSRGRKVVLGVNGNAVPAELEVQVGAVARPVSNGGRRRKNNLREESVVAAGIPFCACRFFGCPGHGTRWRPVSGQPALGAAIRRTGRASRSRALGPSGMRF